MFQPRLTHFSLALLVVAGVVEFASDLLAQRRGRYSSRGSVSRYRGGGYNQHSSRSRSSQRGSIKNYKNNYGVPADAWRGYRPKSGTSTGSRQSSPAPQTPQARSAGSSTQSSQQRSQDFTRPSGQANPTDGQRTQGRPSGQTASNQTGQQGTADRQTVSEGSSNRSSQGEKQAASSQTTRQRSEGGVPDGTWTKETERGGTIELSKSTQGDSTTINKSVTTAEGRTASGTKTATRDGDTINVEGRQQTGSGGSRETSSEIKLDDGRVDEVKRETETTGRYGETIEHEGEIKRDGNELDYKGKTETSTGREVETEADIFRTATGGVGAVGEIDSKYWGNYDFAHGRGPRGKGTALYGPYGGALITTLPNGARRVTVYGYPYYAHGFYYYYPYYWGGAYYYSWAYPPYGSYYWSLPPGYTTVTVSGASYYQHDQVYYQQTQKEGKVAYKVTPAPSGAQVDSLPEGSATLTAGGRKYHYYGNTFYRQVEQNGKNVFVVVEKPAGLTSIQELPSEFEPNPLGAVTYFKIEHQFYLPFLDGEKQVFILVDAPSAPATKSASTAIAGTELMVPTGTSIQFRTAQGLNSGKNKSGDSYKGYLNEDLVVQGKTVAPAGSEIYGLVGEVQKAGALSGKAKLLLLLIDLVVDDHIYAISTETLEIDGEKARSLLKIGGGAAVADGGEGALVGAAIGAAAGTAVAAATGGKQVKIEAQTLLEFKLNQPLTVDLAPRPADD